MEDKEENQDHNHSSLLPNRNPITTKEESLKKPIGGGSGSGSDRLKRDEWSEGAVSTLLEAYEAKWVLRNRAKLKGHDWEDVARYVSSRANSTKSPKTQTQCKNKIESMKKRYRSESATADASSWPLYSRLDLLLRGTGPISTLPPSTPIAPATTHAPSQSPHRLLLEPSLAVSQSPHQPPPPVAPQPLATAQNSHGSNGVDRVAKEDGLGTKSFDHVSNKNPLDTDSSTPALYSEKDKLRCNKRKMKTENNKRRRKEDMEIAESIRWLAEVVVRSEQTRMDTMKEIERMRVEADAKRGEMDLKRTEIIANTQLEIARIFASVNKGVDSSLRIGRS
ncbi:trihelix transcription factor ENAP2 [Gastrolobium bilobum]|uniref:trihelix transcription factor ENAP2 n=1 Tax=Gastrolobium bilobum TaxID=150636 RepID=UPI002AB04452|nr:trihelix transcription factor ENAP2 [Gastrolobium bilobum]